MSNLKEKYDLSSNEIEDILDECNSCLEDDDISWALEAFWDMDPADFLDLLM